jgi:ParB family chromosome partitioning protein
MTRKALGKGLSALLKDQESTAEPDHRELDVDLLEPNRFQPRQVFSEPRLEELAQSIRAHGFIQPIVVRRAGDRYQIIAGERRWRAAQRLGLSRVPVAVKSISDVDLLEVSLIENIQRENLNPIEEAKAYQPPFTRIRFDTRTGGATHGQRSLDSHQLPASAETAQRGTADGA